MAIAGSALNSAIAYMREDGTLYLGLFVMRGSDIVEQDMERAIQRIRKGERLAVWVHGNNVYVLRSAFPSPRPLEAAGWPPGGRRIANSSDGKCSYLRENFMSHDGEYKFDDPWITGLVKELQAENEQLRAQLAAVPVDRIATLTELALRNDDESVQLAGKIIVGWLYEWKVQP